MPPRRVCRIPRRWRFVPRGRTEVARIPPVRGARPAHPGPPSPDEQAARPEGDGVLQPLPHRCRPERHRASVRQESHPRRDGGHARGGCPGESVAGARSPRPFQPVRLPLPWPPGPERARAPPAPRRRGCARARHPQRPPARSAVVVGPLVPAPFGPGTRAWRPFPAGARPPALAPGRGQPHGWADCPARTPRHAADADAPRAEHLQPVSRDRPGVPGAAPLRESAGAERAVPPPLSRPGARCRRRPRSTSVG